MNCVKDVTDKKTDYKDDRCQRGMEEVVMTPQKVG